MRRHRKIRHLRVRVDFPTQFVTAQSFIHMDEFFTEPTAVGIVTGVRRHTPNIQFDPFETDAFRYSGVFDLQPVTFAGAHVRAQREH